MTAVAFKDACVSFAQAAAPYVHITDDARYQEALELVEDLLEEAKDSADDPLNAVVEMPEPRNRVVREQGRRTIGI